MKLIYERLTYKIIGVLYKVHNKLGPALQEKHYQRAIEKELIAKKIPYQREFKIPLIYEGESIGSYRIDFVIDNKVALEIKNAQFFKRKYMAQVLSYLSAAGLKLGILADFNRPKLYIKRIVNPKFKSQKSD